MWYKNIAGKFFGLVTKHACDRQTDGRTDRRTDRQNYDSQDCASIAASRGKKLLDSLSRQRHASISLNSTAIALQSVPLEHQILKKICSIDFTYITYNCKLCTK